MQTAQTKLSSDISTMISASTAASAQAAYASSVGDYQRIFSDFVTVKVLVPVDTNFINAVAVSEFLESGDIVDVAILKIPFLTNIFNPLAPLDNALSQATSIWNGGSLTGSLTSQIMASPNSLNALIASTQSIEASATAPVLS
jgi:hypothetical protein